jgi:hypothetical protein
LDFDFRIADLGAKLMPEVETGCRRRLAEASQGGSVSDPPALPSANY